MLPEETTELILGLEAAGSAVSVALVEAGRGLGQVHLDSGRPSGEILIEWIDRLLEGCKRQKSQLTGLALCLGPGSFTSMRISLATAQALSFALNLPIYTANRLQITAAGLPQQTAPVWVVKNAYKGELYLGRFDNSGPWPEASEPLSLIGPKDFVERLEPGDWVLGDGLAVLDKLESSPETYGARRAPDSISGPDALKLVGLVRHMGLQPHEGPLEPIYLRASEAEINYVARFGSL